MTHTPTLTNGFSRDFSEAGDGRAMTPDIREKAERLAADAQVRAAAVVYKLYTEAMDVDVGGRFLDESKAADFISQALLEAHNAGREEMREEAAKLILDNMLVGDDREGTELLHPRTNPGNKVGFAYATAIRSIT